GRRSAASRRPTERSSCSRSPASSPSPPGSSGPRWPPSGDRTATDRGGFVSAVLLEVPHHLLELLAGDLSAGVPAPQDRVGIVPVPPVVPTVSAPTPAPAAPPAHPPKEEEEQEEEDPAEPEEGKEDEPGPAAADRVGDQGSGDHEADDDKESDEGPQEDPPGIPRPKAHARPPPSATARRRPALFPIASPRGW